MSEITVKKCFKKYGVVKEDLDEDAPNDTEFEALVMELCSDTTTEDYVTFDNDDAYEPAFDRSKSNWKESLRAECIESVNPDKISIESDEEGE